METNAALQSIKVVSDWLKANKELSNYNELSSAVSDVNAKLIASQETIFSCFEKNKLLTNRVTELEKEISQLKDHDINLERYSLHKFKSGMLAYALKPDKANGDPMHYLCNNCIENRKFSKLQPVLNGKQMICHTCNYGGWV